MLFLFEWKLLVFVGCHRRTFCSQSAIGVVKRDHAFNLASRIKNAYLAGTKSTAGFRIADCVILLQEDGFNAG